MTMRCFRYAAVGVLMLGLVFAAPLLLGAKVASIKLSELMYREPRSSTKRLASDSLPALYAWEGFLLCCSYAAFLAFGRRQFVSSTMGRRSAGLKSMISTVWPVVGFIISGGNRRM
jgi:hypothetical protein